MVHVDDWLDTPRINRDADDYAAFVLEFARMPAWKQYAYRRFTEQFKLFCTYEGKRYRVTGASRMGDVWLAENFERGRGYDERVDIAECTDWSAQP